MPRRNATASLSSILFRSLSRTKELQLHPQIQLRQVQVRRFSSHPHSSSSSTSSTPPPTEEYDVTIIGGGAVGSVLAKQLSRNVPSLKISLVDARTPPPFQQVVANVNSTPSPRAYALSPKSLSLLGASVLEQLEQHDRVAYYDSMQVWESDGPAILHFTKEDLQADDSGCGSGSGSNSGPGPSSIRTDILGAVIEDSPMVSCIWDELRNDDVVDLISPVSIQRIISPKNTNDDQVEVQFSTNETSNDDGTSTTTTKKISTNLLIAADGGNSFVRRSLGTFPTVSFGYGRHAVTCTVAIDSSINQIAFQRFQPNGPIALLPVWGTKDGNRDGNAGDGQTIYANIVWSTTPEEAKMLTQLPEEEFVQRMNDLLQSGPTTSPPIVSDEFKQSMPRPLGDALNGLEMLSNSINSGLSMSGMTERRRGFAVPPLITQVVGRRFSFELNLMHARNYVRPRVALVGDAAHTIHPMAGQGLNLGMGDVECIVNQLRQAVESGMGIADGGAAGLEYALQQYEVERQREVVATMGGIQFLHGVFGTTFSPAVHARSVGMNMINSAGPIRRRLARVATGLQGISS